MSAPLNTLQIGLIASPNVTSGSDRYYFNLVRALRERNVGARGVVLGDATSVEDGVTDVASFAPEGSRALRRWTGLRRTIRGLYAGSDLIVSHLAPHAFPVLDIIRSKPLVEHFHGPWALEGRFAKLPARRVALRLVQEKMVYGRAARIIVLSRSFGDVLERDYRISASKIRVIPGGVDLARFASTGSKSDARDELGLSQGRPIVFCVRRLEPTKGLDRLLDAIALVVGRVPDVLLAIAGNGSLGGALARRVRDLGIERNVTFVGKVDDRRLALLYRSADFSVVPSEAWEGFGLVCLESFAAGTPAMVTPVGGLPEAVSPLEPALVFANAQTDGIAVGMTEALLGTRRLPPSAACLEYASEFSWANIARRVEDVYREVA